MKNFKLVAAILLGSLVLVSLVAVLFSKKANVPVDTTRLVRDARLATGSAQPKVTIVEFSDLQCPACKASAPFVKQVVAANPDVQLVYRHFPLLAVHKNALIAAIAAEYMHTQGKFWPFHDVLFEKQTEWSELSDADVKKKFAEYAVALGVKSEDFTKGIEDQAVKDTVNADMADGNAVGINSTPTFYVNGEKTDLQDLQTAVESALKVE